MRTSRTFLLIGVLTALLLSSCKNKKLEEAEKELMNSSVILQDVCNRNILLLAKEAAMHVKAEPIYEIAKEVDSVFQKVIDRDTTFANYIIQNYDSLSVRYHIPSIGIDKDISYQTAKNKLLQLEVKITTDLYKSIHSISCGGGYEASVINVSDTTIISVYLEDIIKNSTEVVIKPNSLTLQVDDDKRTSINNIQYQIDGNYLIVKTGKLSKFPILIDGTIIFHDINREEDFSSMIFLNKY